MAGTLNLQSAIGRVREKLDLDQVTRDKNLQNAAIEIALRKSDDGDQQFSMSEVLRAMRSAESELRSLVQCASDQACVSLKKTAAIASQKIRGSFSRTRLEFGSMVFPDR